MKRGCTQCGECLNVCPVYALFKREEYAPKGKRLLLEQIDPEFGGSPDSSLPWEDIRELARLCAGCERCQQACARKLSTCDLLAEARARNPHWTQTLWDMWIRRAGPLWPMAGKIAMLAPDSVIPGVLRSSVETARALVDLEPCEPWMTLRPSQKVSGVRVALFSGCTAKNARPHWISTARQLLAGWGYDLVDIADFACCGGTLHHAGQLGALAEVRERNLELWRKAGKPVMASFCASCKHSLDSYTAVMSAEEGKEWKHKCVGLSSLLVGPQISPTGKAPAAVGYHQPCHWGSDDPDLPLLTAGLPGLKKGTGLCCGMGGILKMSNPDLSADMARKCLEGFAPEIRHIVTGCSGCVMQLSAAAGKDVQVRHWLDVTALAESRT